MMLQKSTLLLVLITFCGADRSVHAEETLACPGEPFGTELGSNNGVPAKSNCCDSFVCGDAHQQCPPQGDCSNEYNNRYTGIKWQCVEYVRRWWFGSYNVYLPLLGADGEAWMIWNDITQAEWISEGRQTGIDAYNNGGMTRPQRGDLLVVNQSPSAPAGHVALIDTVSASYVTLAEQNVSNVLWRVNGNPVAYSRKLTMTVANGHYTVSGANILGWKRLREGFHCLHAGQSPVPPWVRPQQQVALWVQYTNDGIIPWKRVGGVDQADHVELWACLEDGTITNSWLEPVNWVGCPQNCNRQRVTAVDQPIVRHDEVGRFSFQARVPQSGTIINKKVWFRPVHGDQRMDNWGGMHFIFNVDADAPSAPPGLVPNPATCAPDNSFSFSWSPAPDVGSGTVAYLWKVNNGTETRTTATSVPTGPHATQPYNNTFFVRAEDGAGNLGPYAAVTFCWANNPDPNLGFERDGPPADGIPDQWTRLPADGTGYTYGTGGTPDNSNRYVAFTHTAGDQWNAIGISVILADIHPDVWYRVSYWYRTSTISTFGWRLGAADLGAASLPIGAELSSPVGDVQWHKYWSTPFRVTQEQLNAYPNLGFYYDYGQIGTVSIDALMVEEVTPCLQ